MHLSRIFGPFAVLGGSIRILCLTYGLRLDDTHYPPSALKNDASSCAMSPSGLWPSGNIAQLCHNLFYNVALIISQYLYNIATYHS